MNPSTTKFIPILLIASMVSGQIFIPPPALPAHSYNLISAPANYHVTPGIIPAPIASQERNYAHKAVVENSIAESQLPAELLNPFYKNPAIAEGLARESWFGDKEFPVFHREAEKIPRSEILKVIRRIQHLDRRRRR